MTLPKSVEETVNRVINKQEKFHFSFGKRIYAKQGVNEAISTDTKSRHGGQARD